MACMSGSAQARELTCLPLHWLLPSTHLQGVREGDAALRVRLGCWLVMSRHLGLKLDSWMGSDLHRRAELAARPERVRIRRWVTRNPRGGCTHSHADPAL